MALMKFLVKIIIRFLLKIISPFISIKKERICFESFEGKQIACNPYYIYIYLKKQNPDWQYVWVYNRRAVDGIVNVKRNTLQYIYVLMSSNIYITNDDIPDYVPFRKRQLVINTWHGGGAYKCVGLAYYSDCLTRVHFKIYNKSLSWFISSSRIFTNIISESFQIDQQKFLPFGQPRNDLLLDDNQVIRLNKKVRSRYSVSEQDFIILYAPTFRGSAETSAFDSDLQIQQIVEAVNKRYGRNCVFFVRCHHRLSLVRIEQNDVSIHDVTDYEYMQDLLCAADMLISDYSSCIWDYSFLYRPCFLFVPDLAAYQNQRDFYTPIESWGFPLARTMDELIKAIEYFDPEDFTRRMIRHHRNLGSYEEGEATRRVCDLIVSHIA